MLPSWHYLCCICDNMLSLRHRINIMVDEEAQHHRGTVMDNDHNSNASPRQSGSHQKHHKSWPAQNYRVESKRKSKTTLQIYALLCSLVGSRKRRWQTAWAMLLLTSLLGFNTVHRRWRELQLESSISNIIIPSNLQISVIIMNHARPRMLQSSTLLSVLTGHPHVDQIMLCHSNRNTTFHYEHDKVQNINAIDANSRYGLALRFDYCAQARNDWVLIVDDDQELPTETIDTLIRAMLQESHRVVGHYGRRYSFWRAPHRHGYDTATLYGPHVEVVLTKLLLVEQRICRAFFQYAPLVQDLLPQSRPLWNGEDIFLSLVANHVYQHQEHWALRSAHVWEAPDVYKDDDTGIHDVSGNMDRHRIWNVGLRDWWQAYMRAHYHVRYRGLLWSNAKQRLAESMPATTKIA